MYKELFFITITVYLYSLVFSIVRLIWSIWDRKALLLFTQSIDTWVSLHMRLLSHLTFLMQIEYSTKDFRRLFSVWIHLSFCLPLSISLHRSCQSDSLSSSFSLFFTYLSTISLSPHFLFPLLLLGFWVFANWTHEW